MVLTMIKTRRELGAGTQCLSWRPLCLKILFPSMPILQHQGAQNIPWWHELSGSLEGQRSGVLGMRCTSIGDVNLEPVDVKDRLECSFINYLTKNL